MSSKHSEDQERGPAAHQRATMLGAAVGLAAVGIAVIVIGPAVLGVVVLAAAVAMGAFFALR